MASLSLRHIYKKYPGGVTAVSDFNLEIKDKEFIVFVGPSGCGKTTTLRMIAGLEEITEGELFIGDQLVNDVAPKDRKIAMVFQNYALYPHMSVFENMAFGLKLSKTPKEEIKRRVEEAARSLDIPVRTLECCSGDLADLKVKSVDVEAWSPRQQKYFEVGSCSNLGDAQARRLKIRVNGESGKYFAHTLNNTVVAPPRMLIAFLENNLNAIYP